MAANMASIIAISHCLYSMGEFIAAVAIGLVIKVTRTAKQR